MVRTCLKGLYAITTRKCSVYPSTNSPANQDFRVDLVGILVYHTNNDYI